MTAAAVVTEDLEFMYPGNQELGHDGAAGPWPVDRAGRNLAMYKNNAFGTDRSAHVVGEYNDFMGGYYHKSEFGFGHWALYDEMPGHKLWLWSQSRAGGIWEDLLTDTDGQYMEFQAGRLFNQYSPSSVLKTPITQVPFAPGLTDRWKEIWFPVKAIGGFVDVSPMGVMNVSKINGSIQVGINALAFASGKVIVKSGDKIIFSEDKKFKPMEVFQTSVKLDNNADYEVTVEGMDLRYGSKTRELISRPFVTSIPTNVPTAASLYFEGMELKENRVYDGAREYFQKSLQKDPLFIDAMVAMTELYYRSNRYDSALLYANRALQLDTYNPAANYFAGVTYHAKGDLINAIEALGWSARSMEYRSTAYAQMAGIELQLLNNELAEHYANQSLDFNKDNFNAMQVLAVIYRKSGRTAQADANIDLMSKLDPLNHFADFERYLLHPAAENLSRITATIKNELPYQTFLELALNYYGMGLKEEALQVLDKSPAHPLVTVWKAYLKNDPSLLNEVASQSPAYVFPYRTETASALAWAQSKNTSWKFKYYLALNYLAIQRENEAKELLRSSGQEPDYAPFYLTRAALTGSKDDKQELADLETAQKLAPEEWRTANRLTRYYENHQNQQMAMTLSSAAYKKFKGNPVIGLQYADALLNTGQYPACIKVLESMNIIPSEGSSIGKAVYEQAYLLYALELIKSKKYSEALKKLEKARLWPESLGVGMPYEPDNRIEDYLTAFVMKKLNRSQEAVTLQNSVIDYTLKKSDYPSLNTLPALLVYKQKGETDAADKLLQKLNTPENSDNAVLRWMNAVYKNDMAAAKDLEKEFGNNKYFEIAKKTAEL